MATERTIGQLLDRLMALGYWTSVGSAHDVPVRALAFSDEEDPDATADGGSPEEALRALVAYVERPCACGHLWAEHQPEYDGGSVWASRCASASRDGCELWTDPEPRPEPIPVAPGQVEAFPTPGDPR